MTRFPWIRSSWTSKTCRWCVLSLLALTMVSLVVATGQAQDKNNVGKGKGKRILVPDFALRLKAKKAKTGDVQISLGWNNKNDLDLHVVCPSGQVIHCGRKNRTSKCLGVLDVDMNRSYEKASPQPIENVYWPRGKAPEGRYRIFVQHFRNYGKPDCKDPTEFAIRLSTLGKVKFLNGAVVWNSPKMRRVLVHEFELKKGKIVHHSLGQQKLLFSAKGRLAPNSPRLKGKPCAPYTGKLVAGATYQIDLMSRDFDTYLFVRLGKTLVAQDDDGGEGTDSRLLFTPQKSGTYQILAAGYSPAARGNFTLSVTQLREKP